MRALQGNVSALPFSYNMLICRGSSARCDQPRTACKTRTAVASVRQQAVGTWQQLWLVSEQCISVASMSGSVNAAHAPALLTRAAQPVWLIIPLATSAVACTVGCCVAERVLLQGDRHLSPDSVIRTSHCTCFTLSHCHTWCLLCSLVLLAWPLSTISSSQHSSSRAISPEASTWRGWR